MKRLPENHRDSCCCITFIADEPGESSCAFTSACVACLNNTLSSVFTWIHCTVNYCKSKRGNVNLSGSQRGISIAQGTTDKFTQNSCSSISVMFIQEFVWTVKTSTRIVCAMKLATRVI